MTTGGSVQPLGTLLGESVIFKVPDFQRNYAWQDSNIDAFHSDIKLAYRSSEIRHFLGAFIFFDDPNNIVEGIKQLEIVDGQQRLTTIFLYLAILRDRLANLEASERYMSPAGSGGVSINLYQRVSDWLFADPENAVSRLRSNYLLDSMYVDCVLADPISNPQRPRMPERHKETTLRFRKAHKRLEAQIKDFIIEEMNQNGRREIEVINDLLNVFRNKFEVLRIYTNSTEESFDVFMTLNNRGLALGPSDLVKSLFMKHISKGKQGHALVEANDSVTTPWSEAMSNLEDGDFDQFLRHYLLSIQREAVQGKLIFSRFESLINNSQDRDQSGSTTSDRCKFQLKKIVEQSEIYKQLIKPDTIQDAELRKHCLALYSLLDSYRILMLPVLDPAIELDRGQQREIARLCEMLSIRWLLTGSNAQDLENHFQELSNNIRDASIPLENRVEQIKSEISQIRPQDHRVKSRFLEEIDNPNLVRVVLHRINEILTNNPGVISADPRSLNVEHTAPATGTEEWTKVFYPNETDLESKAPEYSALVEQWGNKTILEFKINSSLKQASWTKKRDGYRKSDGELVQGYTHSSIYITRNLTALENWTSAEIAQRNKWLAETFTKIWNIEVDPDVEDFPEWLQRSRAES